MTWYGEVMTLKNRLPKSLPTYHEDKVTLVGAG